MNDEMMGQSGPTDEVIVACLAEGMSYPHAAEVAGVSAKTVQRRMSDGDFRARVSRARAAHVQEIIGRLTGLGAKAVDVFDETMDSTQNGRLRLSAATCVLRSLREYRHHAELEERLKEVEDSTERLLAALEHIEFEE